VVRRAGVRAALALLTRPPVGDLAQQVEVAAVPRRLLDHVHEGVAQVEVHVLPLRLVVEAGTRDGGPGPFALALVLLDNSLERVAFLEPEVAVRVVVRLGPRHVEAGEVDAEPDRSVALRCLTTPAGVRSDGGTGLAAACSSVSSSTFMTAVALRKSSISVSVAHSSPSSTGRVRSTMGPNVARS
jgi:hypothetical protein